MITCIAIDDNLNSLENLKQYIVENERLTLLRKYIDPVKAYEEISDMEDVDIIFMDIEMPKISGIELAALIRHKARYLVFTTSYTKYAIDAFGLAADAYLLKPYTISTFNKAIERLLLDYNENSFAIVQNEFFFLIDKDASNKYIKIFTKDIISFQISENCLEVYTFSAKFQGFLNSTEKILDIFENNNSYIRINEQVFIVKAHIKKIVANQLYLTGDHLFEMSKPFKNSVANYINKNILRNKLTKTTR